MYLELLEEGDQTILILGVEVVDTAMFRLVGEEKFKDRVI